MMAIDAHAVAAQHASYYAGMMPVFLAAKPPERQAAAVLWTGSYCQTVLPDLIVDRSEVKHDDDVGEYEQ